MKYLLTGCLLMAVVSRAADAAAPMVFADATVVDGEAGKLIPERAVVVMETKITAVVSARDFSPPRVRRSCQPLANTPSPGLWDMHVHHEFPWPGLLDLALVNGVTGVRDLNSEPLCSRGGRR
jgi:hypothetical protein